MNEKKRVIALITDFGTQDYFIGTLRGVIRKINSDAEVIDITHDIPSYSLLPAAFALDKNLSYFPVGTIFLTVVDPGVGTERRILLVEQGGCFFIAPDNGLLTPILLQKEKQVRVLDKEQYFLIRGKSTFEARDKMAPAAAYLAAGVAPEKMGTPLSDTPDNSNSSDYPGYTMLPSYLPVVSPSGIDGTVAYIDKFGNIMTNVPLDTLLNALERAGLSRFKVRFGKPALPEIEAFHETYGEAGSEPFLLIGSHGNLEIAMNRMPAASHLGMTIGKPIRIIFH